jgi:predicted transcriptional regulator
MEFTLSIRNILRIAKITLPFAGIILGPPSSAKTLVLELLRATPNTFYTDSFTPKAFVSHNSGVSEEQLQQIDMLPKLQNNLFMTPELGPVFSSKEEELTQTLGMLTRVLDGGGFVSDTGATGHRGYAEEIMFTWVGAAVDIPHKVYKLLSTLGPKLYFFRINPSKVSVAISLEELKKNNFIERKNEAKSALVDYIQWFDQCPIEKSNMENGLMKIEWDSTKNEDNALEIIIKLAYLLASLRGFAVTWETNSTQGSGYAYGNPIIEHPSRAITSLANLAKGHALLEGRRNISIRDIPLLIKTILSTAPVERVMIFDLLLNSNGELTAVDIENFLNISRPTALRTMTQLKILGLVNLTQDSDSRNSVMTIRLKDEFQWFLSDEFKKLRQGFAPNENRKNEHKKQENNANPEPNLDGYNESIKKKHPHVDRVNAIHNGERDVDTENPSNISSYGNNSPDYKQEKADGN